MKLAIVAFLLSTASALAEPVTGRATVIDGDTLDIRGQRFRLQGVDTPESAQTCQGRAPSGLPLRAKSGARTRRQDRRRHRGLRADRDRPLWPNGRVCRLGALDLNGWLVEQGLGLAYRRYSTAYVAQEDAARAAKRGLWAGTFTPPWDWRRGERGGAGGTDRRHCCSCTTGGRHRHVRDQGQHLAQGGSDLPYARLAGLRPNPD